MKRRSVLAAAGAGTTALLAGCSSLRATPDHRIHISSQRPTPQVVRIETSFDGTEREYGPHRFDRESDEWVPTRFETEGTLTVRAYVDDELVWDDTHEIPVLRGDRESAAVITLMRNGDLFTAVWEDGDSIWDHF
ncbi:hypothetical protein C483_13208 [Natrialba hulunbeirensis JCM 10989]|uniref:Uncharacterized protein n=1 Tax=Natrialba hulunbeirensis JCM 10989 TaxID=1227493 RepID=L9ZWH5_9EURY|nr:hypothetical protein [Natrialba hulunbeirensis]ELY89488.1 hypothetical protein C483_13208 [Natrialba hulunbeirensis JCM 10989]